MCREALQPRSARFTVWLAVQQADVLVFPPLSSAGVTPGRPKASDFLFAGPFLITNVAGRSLARKSADACVVAGVKRQYTEFHAKILQA